MAAEGATPVERAGRDPRRVEHATPLMNALGFGGICCDHSQVPQVDFDAPLFVVGLPARLETFARRRGLSSVRELIELPPATLLLEKNLGKKTLADTHRILETYLGRSWEEERRARGFASSTTDDGALADDNSLSGRWAKLPLSLQQPVLDGPANRAPLPARMLSFVAGSGISTLRELLVLGLDELMAAPNLGRKTVGDTVVALEAIATAKPLVDPLTVHRRWLPLLQSAMGSLPSKERLIVTQRAGLSGPPPTLAVLGEMLGVSRERIRQHESRAIARLCASDWCAKINEQLAGAVAQGVWRLAELGERDAFFALREDEDDAFTFLVNEVLAGGVRVSSIDDELYVSHASRSEIADSLTNLRGAAEALAYPVAEADLTGTLARQLGWTDETVSIFLRLFENDWLRDEDRVVGFGRRREDAIHAFLRATTQPVACSEIEHRFGRGKMPEFIVFVDRGLVTVSEHVPDWQRWSERLGPSCAQLMAEHGPDRQWTSGELVSLLAGEVDLPPWCNAWTLGSLLRRRGEVCYLGRNVVALKEAEGERLPIVETAVNILLAEGEPLLESELMLRFQQLRGVTETSWQMMRFRRPILLMAGDRIGLYPRDVPGGEAAVQAITEALVNQLEAEGRGITQAQLHDFVTEVVPEATGWDPRLCRSVLRLDGRFRLTRGGAVGLAEWPDARVPSQVEALESLLSSHDGTVPTQTALSSIPAQTGEPVTTGSLNFLARSLGADVLGNDVALGLPVAPVFHELSLAYSDITDRMPESSVAMFVRFASEDCDIAKVRSELDVWVQWIREEAKTNMCVERDQVDALFRAALNLLTECEDTSLGERDRRARLAAVRYLACADDAESDISLGGLDDDELVLAAVTGQ